MLMPDPVQEPLGYEELVWQLEHCSRSYLPALLIRLNELVYERKVLLPGGASKIAAKVERKLYDQAVQDAIRKEAEPAPENTATHASRVPNGLSHVVAAIVDRLQGPFTGADIYSILVCDHYPFAAKRPRHSVYSALETLISNGSVGYHARGRRGVPTLYVRLAKAQAELPLTDRSEASACI
jgi:hypothetical protein